MRLRLAVAALAVVLLAACSSDKKAASPSPTSPPSEDTTTTLPATPVLIKITSPEAGSVQGSGGKGMVVVLTITAVDPAALPAQFRVGGETPSGGTKPGHNPAFPGLVVGTTTTGAALGGPTANLANLFQIVSPSRQADGSMKVTAVWTNTQAVFGSDADVTLGVVTVSGTAPDLIPSPLTDLAINSNVASVVFRLSATEAGTVAGAATSTTAPKTSTTTGRATTTVPRGATSTTVARSTTSTTRPSTTSSTARTGTATTTTTKLLGIF